MATERPQRTPFLTAAWRNLVLLNYAVDDATLEPLLPPGCALDRHEGSAWVSVVAFQFVDTRVWRVKWPGFVNFPEINLRFYVTCEGQRGVAFIREYVPSPFVAWMARTLYNEPYRAAPMVGEITPRPDDGLAARYAIDDRRLGARLNLRVTTAGPPRLPAADTPEHFFKEHELGFGTARDGSRVAYRVWHPQWTVRTVASLDLELDWQALYGDPFAGLAGRLPDSVVFADGSDIAVYPKGL